jgi:hypothetical protein
VVTRERLQPVMPEGLERSLPNPIAAFFRNDWVASIRADQVGLSERDYCELLIRFVNEGTMTEDDLQSLLCGARVPSDPSAIRQWAEGVLTQGAIDMAFNHLAELVKYGPRKVQPVLAREWAARASTAGLVMLPVFSPKNGKVETTYRLLTQDLWAAISYAMMLFLSSNRPFGRDLCRCKHCKVFFFVKAPKKSGRPRRDYCSPEHARKAYSLQVRERVAANRAGLSVKDWRKRQAK